MFNLNKFNAMLFSRGVSKEQVAEYLGISVPSLYRRLQSGGDFRSSEIRKLITFFSKEEVLGCLFCYE